MKTCFPDAKIFGCGFHFSQRLNAKWKQLGLIALSNRNKKLNKVLLKTRAMRFLPQNYIVQTFTAIKTYAGQYPAHHAVHEFLAYVEDQWIQSAMFGPAAWCQHGLSVRTNNSTEGYHKSFNEIVGGRPPLYRFLEALHSCTITIKDKLASEDFDSRRNQTLTEKEQKVLAATQAWAAGDETRRMGPLLDYIAKIMGFNPED